MSKGRLKDDAGAAAGAARARRRARRHPAARAAGHAVRGRVDLAGARRGGLRARPADAREGRGERGDRGVAGVPRRRGATPAWRRASPGCRSWCAACARCATATRWTTRRALDVAVKCCRRGGRGLQRAGGVHRPARRASRTSTAGPDVAKPKQAGGIVRPEFEAYVSLGGLIDRRPRSKRLEKQIADKRKSLDGSQGEARQRELRVERPGRRWCSSSATWSRSSRSRSRRWRRT